MSLLLSQYLVNSLSIALPSPLLIMSSDEGETQGILSLENNGGLPVPQMRLPETVNNSRALQNSAAGNSTQFNADVGRRTRYRRDTFEIEDNSLQRSYTQTEGQVQFNISVTQSPSKRENHATDSSSFSRPISSPIENPRSGIMGESHLLPDRRRSMSGGGPLGGNPVPRSPTRNDASNAAPSHSSSNGLTETNQRLFDEIEHLITGVSHLYQSLPAKLARLNRIPGLEDMRKDLNAQNTVFSITIDEKIGFLRSSVSETLRQAQLHASYSQLVQPSPVIDIKNRLEHIKKLLTSVDAFSDRLAAERDKRTLSIRPKRQLGRPSHGANHSANTIANGRAGVQKRSNRPYVSRKINENTTFGRLKGVIGMLKHQAEEFQRICQSLRPPPPEPEDQFDFDHIPGDLELSRTAAIMLCKALCQACPNKKHVHRVLFGLSTSELPSDCDEGDTGVEFNLAFESELSDEAETWFVVQSTMKSLDGNDMEVDEPHNPFQAIPQARLSFSNQLSRPSDVNTQPDTQFCLQYHKQGVNDLTIALKHSDNCEHKLFYPEQARLNLIRENGQAIPLRQLLEERHSEHQLEMLQKIRLARLLAEAVLKFYSSEWLSCDWNWDSVLIYELEGEIEPHLRFEMNGPDCLGKSPQVGFPSQGLGDVLRQLREFLGCIAIGPHPGSITYEAIQRTFGSLSYAEIMRACDEMSETGNSFEDEGVQERFYNKVVARLADLEQLFEEQLNDDIDEDQDSEF